MNRRGASMPGQQRGMDVDHAKPRDGQDGFRKNLSVTPPRRRCRHPAPRQAVMNAGSFSVSRLKHRDGRRERSRAFTGASDVLLSAAARLVRLGDGGDHRMARGEAAHRASEPRTPACRRRRPGGACPLPFPRARELADLPDDQVALDAPEAIDEQRAIEMIDLVLKARAPGSSCLRSRYGDAGSIQRLDYNTRRPDDRRVEPRARSNSLPPRAACHRARRIQG